MTAADAFALGDMIHHWCVELGRYAHVSSERKSFGKSDGYVACGRFYLWHRKYEVRCPFGIMTLSVLGKDVWVNCPRFKPMQWLFKGMTATDAYAAFLERMRVYLEPVGDVN